MIEISKLTKDYGNKKGVFNLEFIVKKGEVFGFLGPNGAGKTTTIRNLLGFIKPDSGLVSISNKNCFEDAAIINKNLGYIPGEINLFDDMTGIDFIKFMAEYRNLTDLTYAYELVDYFDLDASGKIKKMSKGMKQKVGIIVAFMHDPDILILDEPTSGLDPLMQNKFIKLINKLKKEGKTILMSSHMFEEVEKTCDRVAIIKEGRLVIVEDVKNLKKRQKKKFTLTFNNKKEADKFKKEKIEMESINESSIVVVTEEMNKLLKILSKYDIVDLDQEVQHLEDVFMDYYGDDYHE